VKTSCTIAPGVIILSPVTIVSLESETLGTFKMHIRYQQDRNVLGDIDRFLKLFVV